MVLDTFRLTSCCFRIYWLIWSGRLDMEFCPKKCPFTKKTLLTILIFEGSVWERKGGDLKKWIKGFWHRCARRSGGGLGTKIIITRKEGILNSGVAISCSRQLRSMPFNWPIDGHKGPNQYRTSVPTRHFCMWVGFDMEQKFSLSPT